MKKRVILTGDRPTGAFHLGHYVGSLMNRVALQNEAEQYVMIADVQALTDNFEHPERVRENIFEALSDYLTVGIDPLKTTIFIQSLIPAIPELTLYYMNLVTLARVQRNPTVKTEIQQKKYGDSVTVGFVMYPINQVADITAFKANCVPVGADQLPMVEQANEVVRTFNRLYNTDVLVEAEALIPTKGARLTGIDGKAKMSKSLGNAIYLKDSADELRAKVRSMYTDPDHISIQSPGKIEGNTVFEYLDVFATDQTKVAELKAHYQRGGLGDVAVKNYLFEELNNFLEPIRERRKVYSADRAQIEAIVRLGTEKAREIAQITLGEVKRAMRIDYF